MTLRLLDLEAPLEDVEFPNGTKHVPVPFGPKEYQLWRDLQKNGGDNGSRGKALMEIIRNSYPTATEEDLASCTPRMWFAMAAHAGHLIEQVRAALKNVDAAVVSTESQPPSAPSPTTAPSSPKTNGATSSRKSRKRSAATGGTSTTASLTAGPN